MQYSKLDELVKKFLRYQEEVGHRQATITIYQKEFSKDLRYFEGKEFDYSTLRGYLDNRIAEGRKPSSINQDIKRYKAFLNWAANEDEIEPSENFSKKLHIKKVERDENIPSWEVAKKIIDYLENVWKPSHFDRMPGEEIQNEFIPALKLMMFTGIRSGSFATMKGTDLKPYDIRPTLFYNNKGGGRKEIPIPPQCLEDLKKRSLRRDNLAFQFSNPPRYQEKLSNLVKQGAKAIGLDPKGIRPHKFRHTNISHLANDRGVAIQNVKVLVGHSKIETTMHYFHPDKNHLSNVVQSSIGVDNPELLDKATYLDALIDHIVKFGIPRRNINLENGRIVVYQGL